MRGVKSIQSIETSYGEPDASFDPLSFPVAELHKNSSILSDSTLQSTHNFQRLDYLDER